jgi:tetratricopeptide (TPR) repeat protein
VAPLSPEGIERFNSLYEKGWRLLRGRIIVDGRSLSRRPGWWERRRLGQAIACFEQALRIHSSSWQTMWAIGKAHQRLQQHREALTWLMKAHDLEPARADVAREAAIEASELGHHETAVRLTEIAIRGRPNDWTLYSNLGHPSGIG